MIEPSVPSLSASVSMVTLAPRTTGRPNEIAVSSTEMLPFSVIVPLDVSVSVPLSVTAARVTFALVIVRFVSAVVPPTAPCRSTAPVSASSVSECAPSIVEVKVMAPSVVSVFLSLSTLTLTVRSTGPVKVMAPSSLQ